ncbi:disintegrin and metalloproteinase domain-containing protein 9-like isoform X2 [Rhinatrema bivittatum]|uniref:disintegrin and metalloproteinase domain-containing protein 9-like isoform X2 n=1 Tax=Rhinatrema bivittatum TaxID=194408 RepID=UPI0011260BBE|nr:disintegrin and metalloproteinase domain-containing protein 9-like isoform X2 [Rhinatrema bivittatum]
MMWGPEHLPGLGPLLLLLPPWFLPPPLVSSEDLNQTSWLSSYEIIIPKKLESKQASDGEEVLYSIKISEKQYILHLKKKTVILSPYLPVFTYSKSGALIFEEPYIRDDCYFHGYVEGISNSSVAVSTCAGLRGFLKTRDLEFGIEPLQPLSKFQHLVYRTDNIKLGQRTCGINEKNERHLTKLIGQDIAPPPGETGIVLTDVQYIEAFVVVSHQRYKNVNNETAMILEVIDYVSLADTLFQQLKMRIVLVGIEIWTTEDLLDFESDLLGKFNNWKEKNKRVHHDSAALALQQRTPQAYGLAFIGNICYGGNSGFYAALADASLLVNAVVYAHELGHTLGFQHDEDDCHCTQKTLARRTRCLWNYPAPGSIYVLQSCGNKIVESGEECDCGSRQECKKNQCCEHGTCMFKKPAQCAHGECCKKCKFAPAGTQCRSSISECDLPEVCTGLSSECPPDVFVKNGLPCKKNTFFCYNKVCYDYKQHCKGIFGQEAEVAPKACFQSINTKGDRFGNCGFEGSYQKCGDSDVMCGRLQCVHVYSLPPVPDHSTVLQASIEKNLCYGVDHHFGMDMKDFGAVYDGAKCEPGKICVERKCVSLSSLQVDCDSATKCSGKGVCNNKNNCHCKKGFSPPNCAPGGLGGSSDSGPMRDISYINIPTTTEMMYFTLPQKGLPTTVPIEEIEIIEDVPKNVIAIVLGVALPLILIATCIAIVLGRMYSRNSSPTGPPNIERIREGISSATRNIYENFTSRIHSGHR